MSKQSVISCISIAMMLGMAITVSAASIFDITFPIPELGNCAEREACKIYCNDLSHSDACTAFAKAHGLGNTETTQQTPVLPDIGPGGCKGITECKTYCDDASHFDECINFAEQHGLINKKDIQRARKAVEKGPGGCSGIEECRTYCEDTSHHAECAEYAHTHGQISDNDYKTIKEIQANGGPGGCKGQQECQVYCKDPTHIDECLSFGEKNGLISHDDAATIRKVGLGGAGPGNCRGNEECHAYCAVPQHQKECIDFAEAKGLMSKEEAMQARKFAGKTGPGNCQGQEQCRAYCENPDHTEECLTSAQDQGLVSTEEINRVKKFLKVTQEGGPGGCKRQECQTYCQDQAHQEECFAFAKKQGLIGSEEEQQFNAGIGIRKTVQESGGPGGCKEDNECKTYCSDATHVEECIAFAAAHGGISDDQARKMVKEFTAGKFEAANGTTDNFQTYQDNSAARFEEYKVLEQQFRGKGSFGQGFGGQPGMDNEHMSPPPGKFPGQRFEDARGIEDSNGTGEGKSIGSSGNMGRQQSGFVGPGGCTSPTECIKYCSEHRDECFSKMPNTGLQQGEGNVGNQEGRFSQQSRGFGTMPPQAMPQFRSNTVHKITSEDLPQGFEQRTPEERQKFFQEKFQQLQGGEHGGFPGMPPQGFQGQHIKQQELNQENGSSVNIPDTFHGIAPTQGTSGIFKPLEDSQQQNFPKDLHSSFPHPYDGSVGQSSGQYQPHMEDQPMPSSGYQQFPNASNGSVPPSQFGTYPQQQAPTGSGGFIPSPGTGGSYQQYPAGSSGYVPPTQPNGTYQQPSFPVGSGGTFQPPYGTSGTYQQQMPVTVPPPPSGGSMPMPPPPSGSSAGGMQPPPPPPSGMMPQNRFFAGILEFIFGH